MRNIKSKIKSPAEFFKLADELHKQNKTLVQCDGIFDLVHPGHIEYLTYAKTKGDVLYVVLVADKYVEKGPHRPLFDQDMRAFWIAALEPVDFVILNDDYGPHKIMEKIRPDVLVKGITYKTKPTEGFTENRALVESYGGKIEFAPEPMHSTEIINKIYKIFDQ